MKIRVWKMYFFCDDSAETPRYIFDQVGLYTDKELRQRLKEAICDETFGQYATEKYDLDTLTDEQIDSMPIEDIVDIFDADGYEIQENILEA